MEPRRRIYYTEAQKALMWDRWQKGESLHAIARLFGRHHTSIRGILAPSGGIRPAPRRRSCRALTLAEREEISRSVAAGHTIRSMAVSLRRAPSTISRELMRNGGRQGYRASQADQAAWARARRPKRCKLAQNRALARLVAEKLQLEWSPEQIAGWLKHRLPDDERYQVSPETIYRSLFIQARGALKKELLEHLRRTRGMRPTIRRRAMITARLPTPYRSVSGQRWLKAVPCRVTGKATCSAAAATARSQPWLNVTRAT